MDSGWRRTAKNVPLVKMASKQVAPSGSRRSGETGQGEMTVGSFKRLEEIGRGSFATVYKASYSVSSYLTPATKRPARLHCYDVCGLF